MFYILLVNLEKILENYDIIYGGNFVRIHIFISIQLILN